MPETFFQYCPHAKAHFLIFRILVEKEPFRYLKLISEPKYFSDGNFRPFPTLIFFGGWKDEGSSASGVTVNLATGIEPSWWETISVEFAWANNEGAKETESVYKQTKELKKPEVFPSKNQKCIRIISVVCWSPYKLLMSSNL